MALVLMFQTAMKTLLVFGRPSSRPGTQAAFPKVRLVILVEAGTHMRI